MSIKIFDIEIEKHRRDRVWFRHKINYTTSYNKIRGKYRSEINKMMVASVNTPTHLSEGSLYLPGDYREYDGELLSECIVTVIKRNSINKIVNKHIYEKYC